MEQLKQLQPRRKSWLMRVLEKITQRTHRPVVLNKVQVKGETLMVYAYATQWLNPVVYLFIPVWVILTTVLYFLKTFFGFFRVHGRFTMKIEKGLDANSEVMQKRIKEIMRANVTHARESIIIKNDENEGEAESDK